MFEITHYLNPNGRDAFADWRASVKDSKARIAIDRRINRIELGNFGDHGSCREGVWELRIDVGPGYRVYYAVVGNSVVLLLCGGDKRSQDTDIARACANLQTWQLRTAKREEGP
jgi:putative addiction module killer protein